LRALRYDARMNLMKRNVWLLAGCQALMNSGNSLLIATSALVGFRLAPDKALATLPLALQFFTSMLTTVPASFLMKAVGRRAGFMVGTLLGLGGAGLAAWGIVSGNFLYFCLAAALVGAFNGFGTYYRFAAADVATPDYKSRAISYVMAGGVVAAVVGPNLAHWTRGWLAGVEFAGSYLSLLGIYGLSLAILLGVRIPAPTAAQAHAHGRPLGIVARQPAFLVALAGAALGYGVMALVMTATPLAMHQHAHGFADTAFVIEWHLLGMFAPAFVTGQLIRRFGVLNVMLAGVALNVGCVAVNLAGTEVAHFWLALTLLGVGWNFLFVGGTALLTETYAESEKAKAQALNDFTVFTVITAASLSAGALQHLLGWRAVNLGVLPLIGTIAAALLWLKRRRAGAPAAAPSRAD
jgi:MFS family permease